MENKLDKRMNDEQMDKTFFQSGSQETHTWTPRLRLPRSSGRGGVNASWKESHAIWVDTLI